VSNCGFCPLRAHAIIYTREAESVRSFLRDALGFPSVDAGGGWLIFALPSAEIAAHPAEDGHRRELYLMCDDIEATVEELRRKGVEFTRPVSDEGWGLVTAFAIPGGEELALYEPRHPTPYGVRNRRAIDDAISDLVMPVRAR
jgi:predicted enzyme related to lactoylglutathione lyase